jgi:hypothetical protein
MYIVIVLTSFTQPTQALYSFQCCHFFLFWIGSGWQDEFVKIWPKNVAQPIYLSKLIHIFYSGKNNKVEDLGYMCNLKNLTHVNNPPICRWKIAQSDHPGWDLQVEKALGTSWQCPCSDPDEETEIWASTKQRRLSHIPALTRVTCVYIHKWFFHIIVYLVILYNFLSFLSIKSKILERYIWIPLVYTIR